MAVYGGGGGGAGYYGQPPSSGSVRFDALGDGWNLLKQNMGTWIGATLLYLGAVVAISLVVNLLLGAVGLTAPTGSRPGETPGFTPALALGSGISFVINTVLGAFFTGGLYRMAINQARGRVVSVGDLFSAGDVIGPLVVAALLSSLAIAAGMVLCIVPGVLIALLLYLTNPIIVEQRVGGIEAMKMSWNALRGQLGSLFVLLLVLGLINIAGVIPCGLGLLITTPLLYLTIAVVYRDLFPGPGGEPAMAGPSIVMPVPPSATTPAMGTGTTTETTTGTPGGAATNTPPPPPPSTGGMAQL